MGGVGGLGYLPPAPCGGLAGGLLTGGTAFADSFTRAGGRIEGTAFAEKLCCSPRGGWAVSGVGLGWCASLLIVHSSIVGWKSTHVSQLPVNRRKLNYSFRSNDWCHGSRMGATHSDPNVI